MTIRDLEIDILRWDWVTEIRVTEVNLPRIFIHRDNSSQRQILAIVELLTKFAKICTCQN